MRIVAGILALSFGISTIALGASGPAAKPGRKAKPKAPTVAEQIQQLKDQLSQQQSQIQQQQDQIQQLQQQLQHDKAQLQQQTQQLQSSVQQVGQQASAAQQSASLLSTSVSDLKTATGAVSQNLTETQKAVKDLQNPLAVKYKGLLLNPGGFLDLQALVRSRNQNADTPTSFGALPFGGIANSKLSEFRISARLTRLSLLAEGKAGNTKLSGYYEMDFTSPSLSNYIGTNAWNPRVRHAWAQADFANGWTLTAGQNWTLLTTNRKGIAVRTEFIPNTLESAYVVGYTYVRQADVRITKNFNNKVWAAFEVANPETTLSAAFTPPGTFGFANSTNALSPNSQNVNFLAGSCTVPAGVQVGDVTVTSANASSFACNPAPSAISAGMSTNLAPDLIAKVAFEPGWGHYEIKAIGRFFRDRVGSGSAGSTNFTEAGGIGAAAILPVVAKKVDFIVEGLVGAGIGRYGAGSGPDVTLRPDGKVIPIKQLHLMAGLELHPTPKFDVYLYGGDEYYKRADYVTSTGRAAGYGSPLLNNSNCSLDFIPASTCQAVNKNIWEATTGFTYRLYRGNFGTFQYGMEYEYLYRDTWSGVNQNTRSFSAPKGLESIVRSSFRFVLP